MTQSKNRSNAPAGEVRFGPFTFDSGSLRLSRHGRPLPLQTQPARALRALLEARGAIVSRKALQTAVWGDRHVDPELGLNQCIRRIRTALDDRAGAPLYVETVRGEGYRFVAPITDQTPPQSPEPERRRRLPSAAVAAMAILATAVTLMIGARGPTIDRAPEPAPRPDALNVPSDRDPARPVAMPPAAWEAFLAARQDRLAGLQDDPEASLERLQRAVALYPTFAPAWVELARTEQRRDQPRQARHERVVKALDRALEADPEMGEAHLLRADQAFFWEWDWDRARHHYEAAVRYAPERSDAHKGFAFWLSNQGRLDEAIRHVQQATRLDPVSVRLEADLGFFLMRAGRYDEAIEPCRRAIDLDPEGRPGHSCLLEASALLGSPQAPPIDSIESLMGLAGADEAALEEVLRGEESTLYRRYWKWTLAGFLKKAEAGRPHPIALARTYAQLGQPAEAARWLVQAEMQRSTFMPFIAIDPWLRKLSGEPEYDQLIQRLDLS